MENKTVSITVRLLAAISAQIAPASRHEITKPKNLLLLPAMIAVLNLLPVGQAPGQTFTTLYSINPGGGTPHGGLVLSSNTLYGTTSGFDDNGVGYGEVFALRTDGTGFRVLAEGGASFAGLTLSGNTLYGTSVGGLQPFIGSSTVFAVNTDGTGFTNLHTFTPVSDYGPYINPDGTQPKAGVIVSGATLYGTTYYGGSAGDGTIFEVSTNGTGFTVLSDGGDSEGGLILLGDTLYGTATSGGDAGAGSVFGLTTNGTSFTYLHSFSATSLPGQFNATNANSDGASPEGGLVLSGSTFYGTAYYGGAGGAGTVFAVNLDGTGFRVLHSFTPLSNGSTGTNSDGAYPNAGLVLYGNTLYGTTTQGGRSGLVTGLGTVFAINTNGTGFTNLHSFTDSGDGAGPEGGLIFSGDTLYGTTSSTVFSLSFAPQLTITSSGTHVILSWPTNVAGFDYTGYVLQSASNTVSPAVWSTNFPAPVVIASRNTVTNEITGAQQFYRLIR